MINYLHSIKEILKYTNDYIYRKKSISRYMNIFITSMSYKELFFIQNYAKYNKRFGKCIETCKLDEIIEAGFDILQIHKMQEFHENKH